ncbi:hypothetical protein BU26DRAFT_605185 [Trematosphaeria pertusa]|uniref:Uncharacterized protein n=1 Tax=Trematosphaeria pertusa TaxID=390896 RepID=A0A6A6IGJ3_9PLEO|nr:uncharacterized protein BU26DRAFT_605185 [Trematosphaeria pertusa]KAF2249329.1 hypothetical protein BU26DRAFT_605185 [Trematosphaeria pertusa]
MSDPIIPPFCTITIIAVALLFFFGALTVWNFRSLKSETRRHKSSNSWLSNTIGGMSTFLEKIDTKIDSIQTVLDQHREETNNKFEAVAKKQEQTIKIARRRDRHAMGQHVRTRVKNKTLEEALKKAEQKRRAALLWKKFYKNAFQMRNQDFEDAQKRAAERPDKLEALISALLTQKMLGFESSVPQKLSPIAAATAQETVPTPVQKLSVVSPIAVQQTEPAAAVAPKMSLSTVTFQETAPVGRESITSSTQTEERTVTASKSADKEMASIKSDRDKAFNERDQQKEALSQLITAIYALEIKRNGSSPDGTALFRPVAPGNNRLNIRSSACYDTLVGRITDALTELEKQSEGYVEKIKSAEADRDAAQGAVNDSKGKVAELQKKLRDMEEKHRNEVSTLTKEKEATAEEIRKLTDSIPDIRKAARDESMELLKEQYAKKKSVLERIHQDKMANVEAELCAIHNVTAHAAEVTQERDAANEKLATLHATHKKDMELANTEKNKLQSDIATLRASNERDIDVANTEKNTLQSELDGVKDRLDRLDAEKTKLEADCKLTDSQLKISQNELEEQRRLSAQKNKTIEELSAQLRGKDALQKTCDEAQTRIQQLQVELEGAKTEPAQSQSLNTQDQQELAYLRLYVFGTQEREGLHQACPRLEGELLEAQAKAERLELELDDARVALWMEDQEVQESDDDSQLQEDGEEATQDEDKETCVQDSPPNEVKDSSIGGERKRPSENRQRWADDVEAAIKNGELSPPKEKAKGKATVEEPAKKEKAGDKATVEEHHKEELDTSKTKAPEPAPTTRLSECNKCHQHVEIPFGNRPDGTKYLDWADHNRVCSPPNKLHPSIKDSDFCKHCGMKITDRGEFFKKHMPQCSKNAKKEGTYNAFDPITGERIQRRQLYDGVAPTLDFGGVRGINYQHDRQYVDEAHAREGSGASPVGGRPATPAPAPVQTPIHAPARPAAPAPAQTPIRASARPAAPAPARAQTPDVAQRVQTPAPTRARTPAAGPVPNTPNTANNNEEQLLDPDDPAVIALQQTMRPVTGVRLKPAEFMPGMKKGGMAASRYAD